MASVKILYYTKKTYTDGTHPIILQIISGKNIKRKVLGNVKPDQWSEKDKRVKGNKHANAHSINETIITQFNRVEKLIIAHGNNIDLESVFPKENETADNESSKKTFWQIADEYLDLKKTQSGFTYRSFNAIINKFKSVIKDDNILLSQITEKHIAKYAKFMRDEGNAESTQNLNWRVIRFVSNYGVAHKYDARPEALHSFKLPSRKTKGHKKKLTKEELEKFAAAPVKPGTIIEQAKDCFLLSVYLRGIRISDMIQLKESHFKKDRIIYLSSKNEKLFDIKLIPEAQAIVNKYKTGKEYLFTFFTWKPDPGKTEGDNNVALADYLIKATSNINTKLTDIAERAGLDKTVRTHIARHTFAKIAADNITDRRVTMALMGHSDLKVHQDYINDVLSTDELDDAVDGLF